MPVGPNGQIRPESSFSAVIMTCKIATGEIEEQYIQDRDEHKDKEESPRESRTTPPILDQIE